MRWRGDRLPILLFVRRGRWRGRKTFCMGSYRMRIGRRGISYAGGGVSTQPRACLRECLTIRSLAGRMGTSGSRSWNLACTLPTKACHSYTRRQGHILSTKPLVRVVCTAPSPPDGRLAHDFVSFSDRCFTFRICTHLRNQSRSFLDGICIFLRKLNVFRETCPGGTTAKRVSQVVFRCSATVDTAR